jgi:hypothetical protein
MNGSHLDLFIRSNIGGDFPIPARGEERVGSLVTFTSEAVMCLDMRELGPLLFKDSPKELLSTSQNIRMCL